MTGVKISGAASRHAIPGGNQVSGQARPKAQHGAVETTFAGQRAVTVITRCRQKGRAAMTGRFVTTQVVTSGQITPAEATPDTQLETLFTSEEESNLKCSRIFTVGLNGGNRTRYP